MQEDAETNERDADGRRLWEEPPQSGKKQDDDQEQPPRQRAKDPRGESGTSLDLMG